MKITFEPEPKPQPAAPVSEEAPPLHPDTRPGDRILCIEPPNDGGGYGYKPGRVYTVDRVDDDERSVACHTGHLNALWWIGGGVGRAVNYAPTYAEIEARSGKAAEGVTNKRYTAKELLNGDAPCGLYRAWPDKPTPGSRVLVYGRGTIGGRRIMVLDGGAPREWAGSDTNTPFALLDVSPEIVIRAEGV